MKSTKSMSLSTSLLSSSIRLYLIPKERNVSRSEFSWKLNRKYKQPFEKFMCARVREIELNLKKMLYSEYFSRIFWHFN